MKRKAKAVVFDLYSTLIRIRDDGKAFSRLFKELGTESIRTQDEIRKMAFTTNPASISELARIINPNHSVDILSYEDEINSELKRAECFPETMEVLERLRKEGFPIGLISDLPIPYQRPFYDLGLSDMIDEAIFSCEVGVKKPDPRIYRGMLERLAMEAGDVWMVGDNPLCDVQGPKGVGMRAILLDRHGSHPGMISIPSLAGIFRFLD
jgi:HAD superfamily hydrolase (TIGR01549 family)